MITIKLQRKCFFNNSHTGAVSWNLSSLSFLPSSPRTSQHFQLALQLSYFILFRLYAFDDSTCNPLIVLCRKPISLWFIVRIENVSNIASNFLISPWFPLYFASVKSFCNFCSLASMLLNFASFCKINLFAATLVDFPVEPRSPLASSCFKSAWQRANFASIMLRS